MRQVIEDGHNRNKKQQQMFVSLGQRHNNLLENIFDFAIFVWAARLEYLKLRLLLN